MPTGQSKKTALAKSEDLPTPPPRPRFHKVNDILSTIFYVVWIFIGAFFVLMIVGQIRQGALSSVLGASSQQTPTAGSSQVPTETDIPGIGKVNIQCVKSALSNESIQKILTDGNTSSLSKDERAKFDPCVVGPAAESSASPSPSPKK